MIPNFPKFKKIELTDKEEIDKITKKFPPYSDFNFVSMWSWDIKNEMRISQLNGNLVVRFTDYLTSQPFYSFLGDVEINKTVETLFDFLKKENSKQILKLVPELVLKDLDSHRYQIEEDPDHFDYIYKNENLAHFLGKKLQNKRYLYNKFKIAYPNAKICMTSIVNDQTKEDILKLDKKWAQHKLEKTVDFDIKNETMAVERFFIGMPNLSSSKFLFLCLYVNDELVGFSISSIMNSEYTLCHFTKGNIKYTGVYEYMLKNYAENLAKTAHFTNYEQDLGLPSLRFSKNSFRPASFLKKYVIMRV